MLNRIIRASLYNRLAVLIISALLLIAGTLTLMRMEVDIFPDLNAPTVVVMTEAPGLAPEEVETVVTYPVETAVNGSTGVRRVRSTSTTGFSVVWVEFDWGTDIYRARQIVGERLDEAADALPPGVGKPTMGPQSSILGEIMIIGLTSDSTSMLELRRIAEKTIRPRLLGLGGVSQVAVIGGDSPEFRINLDPELMRMHNVSLDEVLAATDGFNTNAGGGVVYDYGNEYIVKAELNTASPDELAAAVVRSDGAGNIITIGDIAKVDVGGRTPRLGVASVEAKPAVIITVTAHRNHRCRAGLPCPHTAARHRNIHRHIPPERIYIKLHIEPATHIARRRVLCDYSAVLLPDEHTHHGNIHSGPASVHNRYSADTERYGLHSQHYEPRRYSNRHRLPCRRCDCRRGERLQAPP